MIPDLKGIKKELEDLRAIFLWGYHPF
jgi:hypothetical protein